MADGTEGSAKAEPLYVHTPTVQSAPLTRRMGYPVYLKLENLQHSGSFKQRGISHYMQKEASKGVKHVLCASGGNAGLATAYVSKQLDLPVTIVLPTTTPDFVADKLRDLGATVKIHGSVWDETNEHAIQMAKDEGESTVYVHPFDNPDLWEGHSSMIMEAKAQMPSKPDVVVAAVGGGGLMNGVIIGMKKAGWDDVPVVAMETHGAACFNEATKAGKIVKLDAITSIAKSLGSLVVCQGLLDSYKQHPVHSVLVSDKEAIDGCLQFIDDHRMMVEPACGASLAALYSNVIEKLQSEGKLGKIQSALVIVCGGSGVSLDKLLTWKKEFDL